MPQFSSFTINKASFTWYKSHARCYGYSISIAHHEQCFLEMTHNCAWLAMKTDEHCGIILDMHGTDFYVFQLLKLIPVVPNKIPENKILLRVELLPTFWISVALKVLTNTNSAILIAYTGTQQYEHFKFPGTLCGSTPFSHNITHSDI